MRDTLAYDDDGNLLIDVRGPRFGASITTLVLATALVVQGAVGIILVALQTIGQFAVSTLFGLAWSPYGNLFRRVKHRFDLGPPPETELEGPPRFAQACGLTVSVGALVAFAAGATVVGWILVGLVLALSSLLALTGVCVGCELYLLGHRLAGSGRAAGSGR